MSDSDEMKDNEITKKETRNTFDEQDKDGFDHDNTDRDT